MRAGCWLTFGLAMLTASAATRAAAQGQSIEYDVKAAFLINFARYVEWPPGARRGQSFGLCVLEPDPFGPRLEAVVAGESWSGRAISVHRLPDTQDLHNCHLLYVPAGAIRTFRAAMPAIASQPILTVGESEDFADAGGMIEMIVDHNKVRFAISQRAAEAAGLRISSRLLRLAREVRQEDARQ